MPIACLALAGLVGFGFEQATVCYTRFSPAAAQQVLPSRSS